MLSPQGVAFRSTIRGRSRKQSSICIRMCRQQPTRSREPPSVQNHPHATRRILRQRRRSTGVQENPKPSGPPVQAGHDSGEPHSATHVCDADVVMLSVTGEFISDPLPLRNGNRLMQAIHGGELLRNMLKTERGDDYKVFCFSSPYERCLKTCSLMLSAFDSTHVAGCQEDVQLREQDWGNFQIPDVQALCKVERLQYGRFFYRFPCGESAADVYDRITVFQEQLVRDMVEGRFSSSTALVIVTHGLTLRVFLMRWLKWTVAQFLEVFNVNNMVPVILEKVNDPALKRSGKPFVPSYTPCMYRLSEAAVRGVLEGVSDEMRSSANCWSRGHMVDSQGNGDTTCSSCSMDDERQWTEDDKEQ